MSWWETGSEQLLIGDLPADKLTDALKRIVAAREARGAAKPDLRELLASLREVLRRRDPELSQLVADTSDGRVIGEGAAEPDVTEALEHACDEVTRTYREGLERTPSTSEILANLLFVLGATPSRFLAEADDLTLDRIAPATRRTR